MTLLLLDPLEEVLFGYLVLSARRSLPTIPPLDKLPFKYETNHIEGSYYGTIVNGSNRDPKRFYYPQRGRQVRIHSATSTFYKNNREEDIAALYATLEGRTADSGVKFDDKIKQAVQDRINGHHFLVSDHSGSQSFVSLLARGIQVGFYGVYCDSFNILAWTNLISYRGLSQTFLEEPLWVYPFEKQTDFSIVLHAQRLCSRWSRWTVPTQGASYKALSVGQRYAALERMLFG